MLAGVWLAVALFKVGRWIIALLPMSTMDRKLTNHAKESCITCWGAKYDTQCTNLFRQKREGAGAQIKTKTKMVS